MFFKKKQQKIRVAYVDGIKDVFKLENESVDLINDSYHNKLLINSVISKKRTASLSLEKITDVRDIKDTEIKEVNKSVVGRAIVGHLLMGSLGAIIGGVSGVGTKQQSTQHHFIIVSYVSEGNQKQLVFEIVGASTGWKDFVAALPKDPDSPFVIKSGTVEL